MVLTWRTAVPLAIERYVIVTGWEAPICRHVPDKETKVSKASL